MKIINAKVYWNKKNGQGRVHIPKKNLELCPETVQIKIPEKFFKKGIWRKVI